MSFEFLLGSIGIGLIYALVSLGVFISFRLLDFPDLTADASFPLGGAVCGLCIYVGIDPWIATLLGMLAGCLAGAMTGLLYVKLNILQLLSSIIVMIGLYSINLRILGIGPYVMGETPRLAGSPNLSLLDAKTIFSPFIAEDYSNQYIVQPLMVLAFVVVFWVLLNLFLNTQKGLALRATGTNPRMAKSQGIPTGSITILGMAISNGLIALGGSLFVQTQGGADITIGVGTIVIGLASIIIGESIFPTKRIWAVMLAVIFGSILYRLFIAFALSNQFLQDIGVGTEDLNLITAILVVLALVLPKQLQKRSKKRGS
ncbi:MULTISPECIES: ABC transporter permease [unclassified Gilliamella]|uniref:ABC transporter permease n=1 Tax=unclassified Gilliamella TaxID=2685620 RepID=UPI001C698F78|nr:MULTISPECIES: ABC transporter permease [unclassified Gilliamella]MCX8601773.1 ABC transporter permease [Gilliamella sp. B3722]MCX8608152.1 ABC transporter permease [Gilliamella sp. B3771]MCX8611155.1 ABC transporter permease [Gilliamella sp. B3891]MCX8613504.1 ABC transporter permease [Gilliamella sp. B3773]MCX8614385.1 ABC transporter permease [Gilliamella sp. B3770]